MEKLHTEQAVRKLLILAGIIFLAGWVLLVRNDTRIKTFTAGSIPMAEDTMDYILTIESLDYEDDHISITPEYLSLEGWILCRGWPSSRVAIHILLRNITTDEWLILPTTVRIRTDVTEQMNDGCIYDCSGFYVNIPQNRKIDTDAYDYEIYALFNLNNIPRVVPSNITVKTWRQSKEEAENG